ncbi:hypothetical protein Pfo_000122, partial [Paulownia fortunei]
MVWGWSLSNPKITLWSLCFCVGFTDKTSRPNGNVLNMLWGSLIEWRLVLLNGNCSFRLIIS